MSEERRRLGDEIVKRFAAGEDLATLIRDHGSDDVTGFLRRGFQMLAEAQSVPQDAIESALIDGLLTERRAHAEDVAAARQKVIEEVQDMIAPARDFKEIVDLRRWLRAQSTPAKEGGEPIQNQHEKEVMNGEGQE